jgi:integrase
VERRGYQRPDVVRFADFAQDWLIDYLPARSLKPTVVASYEGAIKAHLVPALGKLTLTELERHPELIDRFVARKLRDGLSAKTATNQLLVLQLVCKRAVRLRLITRNPVLDVERPRIEQPEMTVLSEGKIARLWTAYGELEREATGAEIAWWRLARTITFTALGTAMRRGELLGLRWRDVQLLEGAPLRARGPRQRAGDHTEESRVAPADRTRVPDHRNAGRPLRAHRVCRGR